MAGLAERTAETRMVLQHCLETATVRSLVAIGSAFVYRLPPGNANRLGEESELDLDPDVPAEIRSWIDCDMILHGEVHNDRLRVVLLRVPTVVAAGGYVYLSPALGGRPGLRLRALGYDPICALVSDKDVARAVQAASHARSSGIYNIAGSEAVPLSVLARWTGRSSLPAPGPVVRWITAGAHLLGAETARVAASTLCYGFTLDTARAERELGFRPSRPDRPGPRRRRRAARGNRGDLTDLGYPRAPAIPRRAAAWPSTPPSSATDSRSSSTASRTRSSASST